MQRVTTSAWAGALVTCACVSCAQSALAADIAGDGMDGGAPAPLTLSPIEVTAQHRVEDPLDVPISMEVLDAFEIQDKGITDLSDALNTTPNVLLRGDRGEIGFSTIVIRGIGNQGGDMGGANQAIGLYVDDVYVDAQEGMNPPAFDLERIEVLRGPQGTLYGRNAMGGAVNIVSTRPQPETELSAGATYGSYDLYDVSAVVNGLLGTVGDAKISARISGYQAGRGTTVDNSAGDDIGDYDTTAGRAQMRIQGGGYDLILRADAADQRGTVSALAPFDEAGERDVAISDPFEYQLQNFGFSANATIAVGDLSLHSITAWRGTHSTVDGNDWQVSDALLQGNEWKQRQISQEFRLTSPDDARLRWVAGIYLLHNEEEERNFYGHRLGSDPLWGFFANGEQEISYSETTTDSQAVFADVTYGITDWLDVTVGGRLSHDRKSTEYSHVSGLGMAPTQTLSDEVDNLDVSPKVNVTVKPTEDIRVYATVSRGYKSGGFNTLFVPTAKLDFDPEHLWAYELGTKMRLFDDRVSLNGALFYMDWYDQQITTFHGTHNDISNVPRSRSYGAEVDMTARVTEAVTLGGAFGWTEATFVDFPNPSATIASGDGFRQPNTPRFTYALSAEYLGDLDDLLSMSTSADVLLRADYAHRTSYYYDPTNMLEEPGYGVLNLRGGLIGDGWRVDAFVRNVTNEDYRTHAISYFGRDLAIAGEPRTVGVQVKLDF